MAEADESSSISMIENDVVKLWIENGVVIEFFKPEVSNITLDMAKIVVRDRLKLSNKVTMPILILGNKVLAMDKDARDYFSTPESTKYLSASAMVLDNYITWAVGQLFLAFSKPDLKVKMFRNKTKAMEWLEHYKNIN